MKKIMQINITCGIGSTGRLAMYLYNESKKKYEVNFCYSYGTPIIKDAFKIETKLQNLKRRALNKYLGKKICHSKPGTMRLIKYIKKEKPDLIHIHNVQQNSIDYVSLFKFLMTYGRPIVFTLHDCWAFTGGCYHFTNLNCEQFCSGCKNCPIADQTDDITIGIEKSYNLKKQLIGKNTNIHVVCVSKWLEKCARKSYMHDMDIQTIYNGIDTDVFSYQKSNLKKKLEIDENKKIILGVANIWDERKGLRGFRELRKRLDSEYIIVVVGVSPKQIDTLESGMIGLTRTSNVDELVLLYSIADVYLNLSKEETFGMTTVEAIACGTPAIVYNSTASPELLTKDTGIIIYTEDIEEIVLAVKKICNWKSDYNRTEFNEYVRKKFGLELMLGSYMKLYNRLLNTGERNEHKN